MLGGIECDDANRVAKADSLAMAVPETLRHPFATAEIVVWPGTCSVLAIAAKLNERRVPRGSLDTRSGGAVIGRGTPLS
jgi:hypothetical protein